MSVLMHGDCLDRMREIPDGSVDMILCDLPYGTTQNKWDSVIPFEPLWEHYKRVIKRNGAVVLTAAQPFATSLIGSNMSMFRYDLVWEKSIATGFLNARKMPLRGHELVLLFYTKAPTYNPQKHLLSTPSFKTNVTRNRASSNYGRFKPDYPCGTKDGSRFPRSVFSVKTEKEFFDSSGGQVTVHPTQKPVALMEYLIRTYTNEGETVLDNCMGSGTTGVACVNTGRNFIGIERDDKYFQIASDRIEQARANAESDLMAVLP